jgi:hypothetical protein
MKKSAVHAPCGLECNLHEFKTVTADSHRRTTFGTQLVEVRPEWFLYFIEITFNRVFILLTILYLSDFTFSSNTFH